MNKVTKSTPKKPERFEPADVTLAIHNAKGMISLAAKALNCDRKTVYRYMKKYVGVRQAVEDERETMTDVAELALYKAIQTGEGWAVCFYLKTQGKNRGYVERQEVTGKDGKEIVLKVVYGNDD